MNDLLRSVSSTYFRMQKGPGGAGEDPGDEKEEHDIEMAGQAGLQDFFRRVEDIKANMALMRSNLQKIKDAVNETKAVTTAPAVHALKARMSADIDETNKLARHTKKQLDDLEQGNEDSRNQADCGPGSSTDRTRVSITLTLKHKLKELMTDFQVLQQQIHEDYRQTVERRVFIVTGQAVDEETVDHLIETGESESVLQKAIATQGRGQITETIAEIQERHDAVKDLERGLTELHQIFLDMAVLVDAQGEIINNIEFNVARSASHVQRARVYLTDAKTYQSNTRKYACCGITTLLIVIIIIVASIAR